MNKELQAIQNGIDSFKKENPDESVGELSDTFHTFNELYHHRTTLLALGLRCIPYAWKARHHEDGTMYDGMFIVGAPTPSGMITYHCDNEYWELFKIPEIPYAPHFDGHTPDDVLNRIEDLIASSTMKLINDQNKALIEEIMINEIMPCFGNDVVGQASFIGFYRGRA